MGCYLSVAYSGIGMGWNGMDKLVCKEPIVNTVGFAGQMVSVATAPAYSCSWRAATGST